MAVEFNSVRVLVPSGSMRVVDSRRIHLNAGKLTGDGELNFDFLRDIRAKDDGLGGGGEACLGGRQNVCLKRYICDLKGPIFVRFDLFFEACERIFEARNCADDGRTLGIGDLAPDDRGRLGRNKPNCEQVQNTHAPKHGYMILHHS